MPVSKRNNRGAEVFKIVGVRRNQKNSESDLNSKDNSSNNNKRTASKDSKSKSSSSLVDLSTQDSTMPPSSAAFKMSKMTFSNHGSSAKSVAIHSEQSSPESSKISMAKAPAMAMSKAVVSGATSMVKSAAATAKSKAKSNAKSSSVIATSTSSQGAVSSGKSPSTSAILTSKAKSKASTSMMKATAPVVTQSQNSMSSAAILGETKPSIANISNISAKAVTTVAATSVPGVPVVLPSGNMKSQKGTGKASKKTKTSKTDGDADEENKTIGKAVTKLPNPCLDCWWDIQTKNWVAPNCRDDFVSNRELEDINLDDIGNISIPDCIIGKSWIVQKAPSGRATCRRCGELIEKNSFRVGYPNKHHKGDYGCLTFWLHINCASNAIWHEIYGVHADEAKKKLEKKGIQGSGSEISGPGSEQDAHVKVARAIWDFSKKAVTMELCKNKMINFTELTKDEQNLVLKDLQPKPESADADDADSDADGEDGNGNGGSSKEPPPEMREPVGLLIPMLKFQKEGLHWLVDRENNPTLNGGILADQMGMGKTCQMIALMLQQKTSPTLVVCPTAAVLQWRNEILRFTGATTVAADGAGGNESGTGVGFNSSKSTINTNSNGNSNAPNVEVRIFHGQNRNDTLYFSPDELNGRSKKMIVVITTYQTMEHEYRRIVNMNKVRCQYCNKMFLPEKLTVHLQYNCGPDAILTEAQRKTDRKEEAIKYMNMGGKETDIAFEVTHDPVRALRMATMHEQMKNFNRMRQAKAAGQQTGGKKLTIGGREVDIDFAPTAAQNQNVTTTNNNSINIKSNSVTVTSGKAASAALIAAKEQKKMIDLTELYEEMEGNLHNDHGSSKLDKISMKKESGKTNLQNTNFSNKNNKKVYEKGPRIAINTEKIRELENQQNDMFAMLKKRRRGGAATSTGTENNNDTKVQESESKVEATVTTPNKDLKESNKSNQNVIESSKSTVMKRAPPKPKLSPFELAMKSPSPERKKPKASTTATAKAKSKFQSGAAKSHKVIDMTDEIFNEEDENFFCPEVKTSDPESVDGRPILLPGDPYPDSSSGGNSKDGELDLNQSVLFSTVFARVILDEAHRIKTRTTSTCQAAFALKARKRWCVSGTPLQNRIGELYSLLRFIQFKPYAQLCCEKKGCDCRVMDFKFGLDYMCSICGHAKSQHRNYFAKHVTLPLQNFGNNTGLGKKATKMLKRDILGKAVLRRTKEERQADLNLPPLTISVRKDAMSASEKDFYQSMYMQTQIKFDNYVEKGTLLHNYAHVFDLIMRLRQAVDHPYLIIHGLGSIGQQAIPSRSNRALNDKSALCVLCQDVAHKPVIAQCGHGFHRECCQEYIDTAPLMDSGHVGCPACFQPLSVDLTCVNCEDDDDDEDEIEATPKDSSNNDSESDDMDDEDEAAAIAAGKAKRSKKNTGTVTGGSSSSSATATTNLGLVNSVKPEVPKYSILNQINLNEFESSTKIEAVTQEIHSMEPNCKALIFSQFIRFLDLIEFRLKRDLIPCAKLTGTQTIQQRNNIIADFHTNDNGNKVLLVSLKAGGEGLNLQRANYIFIMDPWWNPAAELQAMQRAHRIGQFRPVIAKRLILKDTIEEKILELQQKKQAVFDATVGKEDNAWAKLDAEDLRYLFTQ